MSIATFTENGKADGLAAIGLTTRKKKGKFGGLRICLAMYRSLRVEFTSDPLLAKG